jgi:nucleoside-diphosphate-sugar epimerase
MNILIIGGTRFIGLYVMKQLVSLGHNVAVFNRNQTKVDLPPNVTQIIGDRKSIEDSIEEFKKFSPEVVLDMIPFNAGEARRTLSAFEGIAKRIVAISSADVYRAYGRLIGLEPGEPIETPSLETSPLREKWFPYREHAGPDDFRYEYDKIPVEEVYLSNEKIAGTVLRLPMVYGPGDRQHRLFSYLKRINDNRPYILLDEDYAKWKTGRGYVENVAHAIVLAILNPAASHEIYNVAENNFAEHEWVELVGKYSGWNGSIELIERGKVPLGMNINQNIDMSSEKIRKELGFSEIVSLEEGIKRTIEWENQNLPDKILEEDFNYEKEDILVKKKSV